MAGEDVRAEALQATGTQPDAEPGSLIVREPPSNGARPLQVEAMTFVQRGTLLEHRER
jgi:hypothetical protein